MPRRAREKSTSGIYHIMIRGINQQLIFEDDEDCQKFLEVLKDCKAISEYKIYAYCFMGNHIHLLMQFGKEQVEQVEQVFRRIGSRYVYWYNVKYRRKGHLFQDRYKSEPIEDDKYFLACLRYIHRNPVEAGICKIDKYKFSSYNEYMNESKIIDTDFALSMMSKEKFVEFCNTKNKEYFLEVEEKRLLRLTDEQAKKIIVKVTKCENVAQFQLLDIKQRDKYLMMLKEKGLGIRQISRLTGVSYYVVQKT